MQKGFDVVNLHGTVSGVIATPVIGENGNWYIGNDDTGVSSQGKDGTTPHVGENGNWFIGEADTGVAAQGPKGEEADSSELERLNNEIELMKSEMMTIDRGSILIRADSVGVKKVEVAFNKTFSEMPQVMVSWADNENVFSYFDFLSVYYGTINGFTAMAPCKQIHQNASWWMNWIAVGK